MTNLSQGRSGFFYYKNLTPDCQRSDPRQPKEKSAGAKESGVYLKKLKGFAQQMRENPTPTEKKLSDFLTINNIPFRNQIVISPYIIDFLFAEKGLVIELDGQHHNQDLNQMTYDTKRDELLMSLRLIVVRFDNKNLDLKQILEIYKNRPIFNRERIFYRIGHHNRYFQEKGFDTETGSYLKKYFSHYLKRKIQKTISIYKNNLQNNFLKGGDYICREDKRGSAWSILKVDTGYGDLYTKNKRSLL